MRSKRSWAAGSATVFGVLMMASLAWACSPQPRVLGITPLVAPPGAAVRLEGSSVSSSPLQIHWNSVEGPVVGSATPVANGEFSASFVVPEAPPGIYTLVLVARADTSVGRTVMQVSPGPGASASPQSGSPSAVSADLWNGFAGNSRGDSISSASPARPEGSNAGWTAGLGLMGAGALGLSAVTTLRYRRRSSSKGA